MLRALFALLALTACASASAFPPGYNDLAHGDPSKHARGDFDGDGRADHADLVENSDGALVVLVRRAAAPNEPLEIWGGDISSLPYFSISTAPPGTYLTMCHLYDGCGDAVPESVTLTHDAVIVHALEGPAEFLYYWHGSTFRDIIISE